MNSYEDMGWDLRYILGVPARYTFYDRAGHARQSRQEKGVVGTES